MARQFWVNIVLALAVLVVSGCVAWSLIEEHKANDGVRTVLCYFESKALASNRITAQQKHQAIEIYKQALAKINEPDCN